VDHGGSSWKVFTVFSRRNLPPPAMSMHLCTPLKYLEEHLDSIEASSDTLPMLQLE